ncbi:MAG: transketolase [Candidatus Levybacteria bacterium]|nr:transketolase [Candidatus Levybacteria bacterium]
MYDVEELKKKADLVRKWCLVSTTQAGSGHPTSCLSAADIGAVLFDKYFSYDIKNPKDPNNDRFVLSKGHAAPLLYTLFALSGALEVSRLETLRKFESLLEGHPTPRLPFVEAATGSLGQGLSIGAGLAYGIKNQLSTPKAFVLLGDGEMAEGNVWEAANFSSYYKLDNLIAIVDVNRFGQSQETMFGHKIDEYVSKFSAFDWEVLAIDGHDFSQINKAFKTAVNNKSGKPFAIIAKTKKGKGVSFLEDKDGWHGKPLKKEELEKALEELGEVDEGLRFELRRRTEFSVVQPARQNNAQASAGGRNVQLSSAIKYKVGEQIATREVYGQVLAKLGDKNPDIFALDGDTKNSTFSLDFKKAHPDRFIECFIAEQNMVGVAVGLSRFGKIPFVSTFAAFLTRAFDQIRMGAISRANIKFVGSHAGVSIGEDGPSQMALEDLAMFGAIPGSIIFHPCDASSTAKIIPLILNHEGISYLRTLRPKTPVIYDQKEKFTVGGSKIIKSSKNDVLTVACCGITVFEALKAYEELKKQGINIRILDCYSVKPIDSSTMKQCINETIKPIVITVEDHYEHGGLGDFVLSAVSQTGAKVEKMAVSKIMQSGTKDELLDFAGISAKHIVEKVKSLI